MFLGWFKTLSSHFTIYTWADCCGVQLRGRRQDGLKSSLLKRRSLSPHAAFDIFTLIQIPHTDPYTVSGDDAPLCKGETRPTVLELKGNGGGSGAGMIHWPVPQLNGVINCSSSHVFLGTSRGDMSGLEVSGVSSQSIFDCVCVVWIFELDELGIIAASTLCCSRVSPVTAAGSFKLHFSRLKWFETLPVQQMKPGSSWRGNKTRVWTFTHLLPPPPPHLSVSSPQSFWS